MDQQAHTSTLSQQSIRDKLAAVSTVFDTSAKKSHPRGKSMAVAAKFNRPYEDFDSSRRLLQTRELGRAIDFNTRLRKSKLSFNTLNEVSAGRKGTAHTTSSLAVKHEDSSCLKITFTDLPPQ